LQFTLFYVSGATYLEQELEDYQSDAAEVGIDLQLSSAPFNTVLSRVIGPTTGWEMGTWGDGFSASLDAYPSGELVFPTLTDYSTPTTLQLINATVATNAPGAIAAYDDYISKIVPVIWQICTYNLNLVDTGLHGVVFNAIGNINPEDWYFTSSS
jgi:peptide/nickel transport system substrate-binding protein